MHRLKDNYFINTILRFLFFNSSRYFLQRFLEEAAQQMSFNAYILDAGAGDCRYASLFSHTKYFALDFAQVDKSYGSLDVIADLASIPLANESFDAIICTQVLEHVPSPQMVLAEFYRLLRPGGSLWITVPLYYEEHEIPFDYYRYTQYGLRFLFEKAGFIVEEIGWLEGYWGTLSYQWRLAAYYLPLRLKGKKITKFMSIVSPLILGPIKFAFGIAGLIASYLDVITYDTSRGHCKNYRLVARKPLEKNNS